MLGHADYTATARQQELHRTYYEPIFSAISRSSNANRLAVRGVKLREQARKGWAGCGPKKGSDEQLE